MGNLTGKEKKMSCDIRHLKTTAGAAKALHKHLGDVYGEIGGKTAVLWTPDDSEARGCGRVWRVMWEEGPHEWALCLTGGTSMFASELGKWSMGNPEVVLTGGEHWWCEPHYSFDLGFHKT
jgi:hypothetical protein